VVMAALGAGGCEAHGARTPVRPPPIEAADKPPAASPSVTPAPPPPPPPSPPVFYRTQRSDEWVERTMLVQSKYDRVLLVDASGAAPHVIRVERLALNARSPSTELLELPVDRVFATLQEAANAARGGDLVAVTPGTYQGFFLGDKPDAGDGRYIHFRALGAPGQVTIDKPCPEDRARWMVLLQAAHHVILQGFNIQGKAKPGEPHAEGPWAGIMLDGDFGRTGRLTHHIAIIGNFSHNHVNWGLHSTDSHSVLLQDNLFALSAREHSAYVSDGSDNYVIRRNVFFGSYSSGLQCNLDPEASLEEVMRHHDNLIRNNTVLMSNPKRAAILLVNGSYGCRLRSNILINDADASVDVDASSVLRLDAGHDVINTVRYRSAPFNHPGTAPLAPAIRALATSPPEGNQTSLGVTRRKIRSDFVAYGEEPWVIIDGSWWRRNPKRPDFRPRSRSSLLAGKGDPGELAPLDLEGRARKDADIGALAR
jgi:hypothetical protein